MTENPPPISSPQQAGPSPAPGASDLPRASVMYSVALTLISALSALNNYLKVISSTVLATDLAQDQAFAAQISAIHLQMLGPGGSDNETNKQIQIANQQKMLLQQAIQAQLKAHQNQEQMDMQVASSTSTNASQLTQILSSISQIWSAVANAVNSMGR